MKTLENWKKDIEESLIDNRTHLVASCPICGEEEQAAVDSSSSIARAAVIGKIVSHIKDEHPDLIEESAI